MAHMFCFAHRGASGHEPENTLSAIDKAIVLSADWIEVDVYAVEDELIVIHDDRLERTTDGCGYVMDKTLSYLQSLDAGKGQHIPTLREVFDIVDRRTGINVELKGSNTARLAVSLIREYVRERKWEFDNFLVSSFNRRQLMTVRKLDSYVKIGLLINRPRRHYKQFAAKYAAYSVHPHFSLVNAQFVRRAHGRGLKVFTYTVNRIEDIEKLSMLGVDGVFTDFPELVTKRLS